MSLSTLSPISTEALKLHDEGNPFIETSYGKRLYISTPKFDVVDIAHGLSMQVRFGGQCSRFYSVAEHSVLVACIMDWEGLGDPLEGLLHDAEEAFLGDMPTPIKYMLPDLQQLSNHFQSTLRAQFELPPDKTAECHKADKLAGLIEADQLMPSRGVMQSVGSPEWLDEARRLAEIYCLNLSCWEPKTAKTVWLHAFNSYTYNA